MEKMRLRLRLARRQPTPKSFRGRGKHLGWELFLKIIRIMDNYDLSHKQADCTCQWHICRFSQSELRHCCSGEKYSSKAFLLSFPALALLSFTFETSSKLGCLCFTFVLREYCAIQFVNQYCLGEKQGKARKVFFEKPPYLLLMRQVLKLGAFVSDFFPEY